MLIVLIISAIVVVGFGAADISIADSYKIISARIMGEESGYLKSFESIIINYRLPRVIMAIFVGIGLSVGGCIMQSVVQNPIADPYVLGISAGAYVGAVLYFIFGQYIFTADISLMMMAFMGSIGTCLLVISLAKKASSQSTVALILIGSVTNIMFMSVGNFFVSVFASDESIINITFWTLGSLRKSNWDNILIVGFVVMFCTVIAFLHSKNMDILLQGDEIATTLGLNVSRLRYFYLIITSLMTGFIVAKCGVIGFVGLIVPHISRIVVGSEHRLVLPMAMLIGSILLLWTDALSRVIISNAELPIGIITSLVGAPLFAGLLIKKGYGKQ